MVPSDSQTYDYFGESVAISGSRAIIGAQQGLLEPENGKAYIFVRTGPLQWEQEAVVVAPDGAAGDQFGISVSISGDYAIVGAPKHDNQVGAAYIYERGGSGAWSLASKLGSIQPTGPDTFGYSVTISGSTALVGAISANSPGENSGAGFVYERQASGQWVGVQTLSPSLAPNAQQYGASVALNGDTAALGSGLLGQVLLYERTASGTFEATQALVAAPNVYGYGALAIDRARLAVGAQNYVVAPLQQPGAAFVFERDASGTWVEAAKFVDPTSVSYDAVGASMALVDDTLIAGAPGMGFGAIQIYTRDSSGTWSFDQTLPGGGPAVDFGRSVAASGPFVVVGAPQESGAGLWSGAAYVFGEPYSLGAPCVTGPSCESGFCADGVCCDTACGTETDCSRCALAGKEGTCSLQPAGAICRQAAAACDVEEICSGSSSDCPSDQLAQDGLACDDANPCTESDRCNAGLCVGDDTCTKNEDGGSPPRVPRVPVDDVRTQRSDPSASGGCGCRSSRLPPRSPLVPTLIALALLGLRRARKLSPS